VSDNEMGDGDDSVNKGFYCSSSADDSSKDNGFNRSSSADGSNKDDGFDHLWN
jgi:hypothetical protein